MLLYRTNSWHYQLILWTWGKHFFEDSEIDMKAYMALDSTKLKKLAWEEIPRKYTTKTVNFCPYCRALVGAVISAPFVYLWRLFPHKKSEPLTREGIKKAAKRRTRNLVIGLGIFNGAFVLWHLSAGAYYSAAINISTIAIISLVFYKSEAMGKALMKLSDWIAKHRKPKVKVEKVKAPKKPSKIKQKIAEKHDLFCPPVYFVEPHDPESLK